MSDVIRVWKRIGETPLQALKRTRSEYNIPDYKKGCYTGRLDPMAQGVITLLFGQCIHHSHYYNSSVKTYRFQAILGISTTSYDPLGRITNVRQVTHGQAEEFMGRIIDLSIGTEDGMLEQQLPPYSAYRHNGKPLWLHAKEGTLPNPLPTKMVKIYNVKALQPHPTAVDFTEYRRQAIRDIVDVKTNTPDGFEYESIISDWRDVSNCIDIYRISIEAEVGSGTFIRSLVHDTAREMGIPAHTFRITRTQSRLPTNSYSEWRLKFQHV